MLVYSAGDPQNQWRHNCVASTLLGGKCAQDWSGHDYQKRFICGINLLFLHPSFINLLGLRSTINSLLPSPTSVSFHQTFEVARHTQTDFVFTGLHPHRERFNDDKPVGEAFMAFKPLGRKPSSLSHVLWAA